MKKRGVLIMLGIGLWMSGCSGWVKPTDAGLNVRVAYLSQIVDCKKLGRATVSVLDKIAFVARNEDDVSHELEILGRNAGSEMQGDTVVAMSKVNDGEQVFNVYRCRPE